MTIDGRDLQDIQARFKVHVSLIPEPPTLRGEGLKSALDAFEGHLASLKKVRLYVYLPSQL